MDCPNDRAGPVSPFPRTCRPDGKGRPGAGALRRWFPLLAAVLAASGCAAGVRPAYVFVANFYPSPVSLRIGEDPAAVFSIEDLPADAVSPLGRARACGDFDVAYKTAGRETWQRLPGELARSGCRIESGSLTAVVIDRRGFIRSEALADDARPGARLCFLNAADSCLAEAAVSAPGADAFPIFWTSNLKPGAATRFSSVVPGTYRLSAVFPPAPADPGGKPGDPAGRLSLDDNLTCLDSSYWLLYAYRKDDTIVLGKRLLATRDLDRLVPPPSPE